MSPILKIHSISFALSSVIVYNLGKYLYTIQTQSYIINFLVTFLLSLSFYKMVYNFFLIICKKIRIVRKIVLGKSYFEGFWIGYYTVNSNVEFYYEFFEQDLEELTIKGKAFNINKKITGEWTITNPTINVSNSKFTYYYEMDVASSNDVTLGCSKATIYWDKFSYPNKLIGFAIDNCSLSKQPYVSIKVNYNGDFEKWLEKNFWTQVENLYRNRLNKPTIDN
ncbi:MAG: hypothetical protein NC489_29075 [Ruminococcus flavefaciens]|nr:hypothetical protein [Ruminococcus flavefaciens]